MAEQGKLGAVSLNGIQLIETLKASGTESDFFSRWEGSYRSLIQSGES